MLLTVINWIIKIFFFSVLQKDLYDEAKNNLRKVVEAMRVSEREHRGVSCRYCCVTLLPLFSWHPYL